MKLNPNSKRLIHSYGVCGESREASHIVTMTLPVSVSVCWPVGIPLDVDECRKMAATTCKQCHGRDVGGRAGKIVWAQVYSDACESDVSVESVVEVKP